MVTRYLRFADLKERGIVNSWTQLRRMINDYGFPAGKKLGPNTTVFGEDLVAAWLDARPTEPKPWPAKARRLGNRTAVTETA